MMPTYAINNMNPYTFRRGQQAVQNSQPEARQTGSWVKAVFSAKLSLPLAFSFLLFAAVAVSGITLIAQSEMGQGDYFSLLSASASQPSQGRVLGVAAYGYNQPTCYKNNCLSYQLLGFSGSGWQVQINYQLNKGLLGAVRVNTWPFMDNITGSGSGQTGYDLLPNNSYNFVLYQKSGNRLLTLTSINIQAPPAPKPICPPTVPAPTGCYYDHSNSCSGNLVCKPTPPPTYGYTSYAPSNTAGSWIEGWVENIQTPNYGSSTPSVIVTGWAYDQGKNLNVQMQLANSLSGATYSPSSVQYFPFRPDITAYLTQKQNGTAPSFLNGIFTAQFNNLPAGSYTLLNATYDGYLFNVHNNAQQPIHVTNQAPQPEVYGTNPSSNTRYVTAGQTLAPIFSFRVYAASNQDLNLQGFKFAINTFPDGKSVDGLVSNFRVQQIDNSSVVTSASSALSGMTAQATFNAGSPVNIAAGQSREFVVYADFSSSLPSESLAITLKQIMNTGNVYITNSDYINGVIQVSAVPQPSSVIVSTGDSLNLIQGSYGKIGFTATPVLSSSNSPVPSYSFTESGAVPGMVFESYPCHTTLPAACPMIASINQIFLDGTPSSAGTFPVTVTATDSHGNTGSQQFTVTIINGVPTTGLRVGQIINNNGTVQLVGAAGLYGFPDVTTFNSWGFSFANLVAANPSEKVLPQIGMVPMKQAGCNAPLDQINGRCGGSNSPVISGVSGPTSLNVGATGTWTVSASDPLNGTLSYYVNWGDIPTSSAQANPSTTTVPWQQSATFTHVYNTNGIFVPVFYVSNSSGSSNTSISVKVSAITTAPVISYLSPASGPVGTNVTITGSGFTATGNTVNFGGYEAGSNLSSSNGTTLSFSVPINVIISPCTTAGIPGEPCDGVVGPTGLGIYPITVINNNGTSNSQTFTVTSGSVSAPVITNLSPTSGPVGTTVTVTGSGFLPNDQVSFDQGMQGGNNSRVTTFVDSNHLMFVVPSFISAPNSFGPIAVVPGQSYYVRVVRGGNTVNFTVSPGTVTVPALTVGLNPVLSSVSVTPGAVAQKVASFIITGSNVSNAQLSSITVAATRNTIGNNFQNLVLKSGSTQLGSVYPVFNSNGSYIFSLNSPLTLPAGGSIILDVYVDVSSSVSGVSAAINNQNLVSLAAVSGVWTATNTVIPSIPAVAGQTITINTSSASLNTPTLMPSSPVSQSVIGGSTNQPIAVFNFSAGSAVTIQQLTFNLPGTVGAVTSVIVGGISVPVINGVATVTGLNLSVPASFSGLDVPVAVNYASVGPNGVPANSTAVVTLTGVKYLSNNTSQTLATNVSSNTMTLVASSQTSCSVYDYNCDGKLDNSDLQILVGVATNIQPCPSGKLCDIFYGNNDTVGSVNTLDLLAYQKLIAGTPIPLTPTPASLSFSGSQSVNPLMQTISLIGPSGSWIANVSNGASGWLRVNGSGNGATGVLGATTLNITAVSVGQSVGNGYSNTITISSYDSPPRFAPITIPVSLTVTGSSSGTVSASPSSVNLSATQGASPVTQQVTLANYPDAGGSIGAQSSGWLSFGGPVSAGSSAKTLTVMATPGSFPAGSYNGTIVIVVNSQTLNIPVTFTITSGAGSGGGGSGGSAIRVGQIINNNSTVQLVGPTGLYGFPDVTTFNSWGFSFLNVVTANTAEKALSQIGWVPTKQSGCSTPLAQINGTCGG